MGRLDWKWIGLGVLIMVALNIVAGVLLALVLAPQLQGATSVGELELTGGQIAMAGIANLLIFLIGGFIVAIKSAGKTIIEPGISAAIAVLVGLLLSGNFSIGNLIAGGLVPFVAGVAGGWYGERRQGHA